MTIAALAPYRSAPVRRHVEDDTFSDLYRQYRPQLFRYITHHFGPRDADEITQETLTRALRAMDRDRTEAETWAWLIRVARNVAHDLARGRRICEATDDDTVLVNDVADDTVLPEPAALLNERRRLVRTALKTLPPSQRRILVLYEVDELNCPAIARLVGSTEDAVRKALQRARRRFAAEVRALGGGTAGSVVFWLRGLRRRSFSAVPAASSAALCAIVGGVALTVTVQPAVPHELSPRLAPPMAVSTPEYDAADVASVRRTAPVRVRTASSVTATETRGDGRGGDTGKAAPKVALPIPETPFSPGQRTTIVTPRVETPVGDVYTAYEMEMDRRPGLVCTVDAIECEYESES
ncbi:MAG TPA: sigma-70 family RNA polymerase sigma factor [Frankiaceae bacterium]|nr:sigma-70 family RNA polymerase sigma factor [Frankiaceae bacterium]